MKQPFLIGLAAVSMSITTTSQALEMNLTSRDAYLTKDRFAEIVDQTLPNKVKNLGPEYRLIGVVETSSYQNGSYLFYYSLMIHRKVIERETGAVYWAVTGGVRAHGITVGGEELARHIREDVANGADSFKTGQN